MSQTIWICVLVSKLGNKVNLHRLHLRAVRRQALQQIKLGLWRRRLVLLINFSRTLIHLRLCQLSPQSDQYAEPEPQQEELQLHQGGRRGRDIGLHL